MNCVPSFQLFVIKRICNHLVPIDIDRLAEDFATLMTEVRQFVLDQREIFKV